MAGHRAKAAAIFIAYFNDLRRRQETRAITEVPANTNAQPSYRDSVAAAAGRPAKIISSPALRSRELSVQRVIPATQATIHMMSAGSVMPVVHSYSSAGFNKMSATATSRPDRPMPMRTRMRYTPQEMPLSAIVPSSAADQPVCHSRVDCTSGSSINDGTGSHTVPSCVNPGESESVTRRAMVRWL